MILVDDNGSKWQVLIYQGYILRAYNMEGFLLSEAKGETIFELITELEAIEEISIINMEQTL